MFIKNKVVTLHHKIYIMKHTYNDTEKEQICQIVYDYLTKHRAWGGEMIGQDDEAQIDAIKLACDLADVKDITKGSESKSMDNCNTIWDYLDYLGDETDEWRYASDLAVKYHREGKDLDEYLHEIIQKVKQKFK